MDEIEKYLREVNLRLRREGFTIWPKHDGQLAVEKDANQFCRVNRSGGVSYDPAYVRDIGLEDALDRVTQVAKEAMMYMRQMEVAPVLKTEGLSGDYRLLAEFNGVVLAGHERTGNDGVEFITWERIQAGTSLWQGHYLGNNYAAARQDFAVRSGLVDQDRLFSDEQLAEIYRCIQETLDSGYPITDSRRELLERACTQIENAIPDLDERVYQSNQADLELADRSMTLGG